MSMRLRRGAFPGAAPPPPPDFGPRPSRQTIRDGAGPDPVNSPGGGVTFTTATTSAQLQTLINNNAYGTNFVASGGGTYTCMRGITYTPSSVAKHPAFWFPGNASSYSITGGGAGSIGLDGQHVAGGGVDVHGGTWSGYGAINNNGWAIVQHGHDVASLIEDAVFTANETGIGAMDDTFGGVGTIRRCRFQSNLRYGVTYTTLASAIGSQIITEYCEFVDNNTQGRAGNANYNPGGDAGPQKANRQDGSIWRYNWYHDDYGFGIWCDGYGRNLLMHDNVLENELMGFFYEIHFGGTVFEHNYVKGLIGQTNQNYPFNSMLLSISCSPGDGSATAFNGGGPNVTSEIRYNEIDTQSDWQTPIGLFNHSVHPDVMRTRNWYVHHNRIWIRGASGHSRTGLADASNAGVPKEGDIGTSPGNPGRCLFDFNEYHVADISAGAQYWEHDTLRLNGISTWAQFQARGHEQNGTRVVI